MNRRFLSVLVFLGLIFVSSPGAFAAEESWQDTLSDIETLHQGLKSPGGVKSQLFDPAMNSDMKFRTMDGSQEFSSAFLCSSKHEVVQVTAFPAANGELDVKISYDITGQGDLTAHTIVPSVGGACLGGAVFECSPAGTWKDCKYGLLQFQNSQLEMSATLPSGQARPAMGLQGCFCFSDHCGGTAGMYMENILTHMGQPIAEQIAASRRNLVISVPVYDAQANTMTWYAGDVNDCEMTSMDNLTSQFGKLELNYHDAISSQEEGSPWDLVTKSLERKTTQFVCEQRAKVTSEWTSVERKVETKFGIGWDTDGSSKQCFWFSSDGGCGNAFGEPRSWSACLSQAQGNLAGICHSLWVGSGFFTSITDARDAHAVSGVYTIVGCYGSGDSGDQDQWWQMDCFGMKNTDRFVCMSSNKTEPGQVLYNSPYDPLKYDGCDEIRPYEDSCAQLAKRDDCRLVKEVSDGAITIQNGAVTSARPLPSCKTVKGAKETRTVCEPWWVRTRTYECSDLTDDFASERERAQYISGNLALDENNRLSAVGDLSFAKNGTSVSQVIDADLQFDARKQACEPACVIQREVPNYELTLPGQGKLAADGSYHVDDEVQQSIVPAGMRTILETVDCELQNNQYTCPIPAGWEMRAQCSCADGQEFIQAISSLVAINEVSKDFICSTGKEAGVCDAEAEGQAVHPVVCGKFSSQGGNFVKGVDYWECGPKFWAGRSVADQVHSITVDANYNCQAYSSLLDQDADSFENNLGPLRPQAMWFHDAIKWAQAEIVKDASSQASESENVCDCATDEINTCQAVASGEYVCLIDNFVYKTADSCQASCNGKATFSPEKGLCIWKEDTQIANAFTAEYHLKFQPEAEKMFGEVLLFTAFQSEQFGGGTMAYCEDKTIVDQAIQKVENISCNTNSRTETPVAPYTYIGMLYNMPNSPTPAADALAIQKVTPAFLHIKNATKYYLTFNTAYLLVNNKWISATATPVTSVYNKYYTVYTYTFKFPGDISLIAGFYYVSNNCNSEDCPGGTGAGSAVYYTVTFTSKDYTCPQTNTLFADSVSCTTACQKAYLQCENSGKIVTNSSECITPQFQCSNDNQIYSTEALCASNCLYEPQQIKSSCLDSSVIDEAVTIVDKQECGASQTSLSFTDTTLFSGTQNAEVMYPNPGSTSTASFADIPDAAIRAKTGMTQWQLEVIWDNSKQTCYYTLILKNGAVLVRSQNSLSDSKYYIDTIGSLFKTSPDPTIYTLNLKFIFEGFEVDLTLTSWGIYGNINYFWGLSYYYGTVKTDFNYNATTYTCPLTQAVFTNKATCDSACSTTTLKCENSGKIVASADECSSINFSCPSTGASFNTLAACDNVCPKTTSGTVKPCATVDPKTYSLWLKKSSGSFGLNMSLAEKQDALERFVVTTPYAQEELILAQCVDRYTNPYIKFDEPGSDAHFEFAYFDLLAFQIAGLRKELPIDRGVLPALPAVYAGTARKTPPDSEAEFIEEMDDQGNFFMVPNPDYVPPAKSEIPVVDIGGDGTAVATIASQAKLVPKTPMFLGRSFAGKAYTQEGSQLGTKEILAQNLRAYVYYYECPEGEINATKSCGQVPPSGGIAATIAGEQCIQYLCDDTATVETSSAQYSGCGLTNDALVAQ